MQLKVLEGHTVFMINLMLHPECDELVTEEDFFHLVEPNHNKLLIQSRQVILRKLLFFYRQRGHHPHNTKVAKPAIDANAWQHQSGTLAKFTGQDFYQRIVYGPPETLDNVSAGPIAPLQQSLPNLVPLEPVCTLF